MKLLLEVSDNKAIFLMEILKNFSFVKKAVPISGQKAEVMQDIIDAVQELKLVKQGKLKARNAEDLFNEL